MSNPFFSFLLYKVYISLELICCGVLNECLSAIKEREHVFLEMLHVSCHWGDVNEGYGFVGRPHPCHPSIPSAPSYGLRDCSGSSKKTSNGWNFNALNINVCKMKGLLFIPLYENTCVGFWRFPKFPMELPLCSLRWHHLLCKSF